MIDVRLRETSYCCVGPKPWFLMCFSCLLKKKSPDKIQLRRSWISTRKATHNTEDNLAVLSRFQGARARKRRDEIPSFALLNFGIQAKPRSMFGISPPALGSAHPI